MGEYVNEESANVNPLVNGKFNIIECQIVDWINQYQ